MSDPLTWSPISLGRWFGTAVRVHVLLVVFLGVRLTWSAIALAMAHRPFEVVHTACWLGLLLLALALHELAHAGAAFLLDFEPETVRLWPLGDLAGPAAAPRLTEPFLVAAAGPIVSGAVFLVSAIGLDLFAGARIVWSPLAFPSDHAGVPMLEGGPAAPLSAVWTAGWFGYLNGVLFFANLLPALPFDCGRMLRSVLHGSTVLPNRESPYAPNIARAFALILGFAGLWALLVRLRPSGALLIALAVVVEYFYRAEARLMEEDGYLEGGAFGYDFSGGYSSLEPSARQVRPRRESAFKRWRRRRIESRREQRLAREIAEERRMDRILDKLYREGRDSLTTEENRFLVRVSVRFRNRINKT